MSDAEIEHHLLMASVERESLQEYLARLSETRNAIVNSIERPPLGYSVAVESSPGLLGAFGLRRRALERLKEVEESTLFRLRGMLMSRARQVESIDPPREDEARALAVLQTQYDAWIERCDLFRARDSDLVSAHIRAMKIRPSIGLIVDGGSEGFPATLKESLAAQIYREFSVTIVANGEGTSAPSEPNAGHATSLDAALGQQTADWVMVLKDVSSLPPQALWCFADAAAQNSGVQLIYADEDLLDPIRGRCEPNFKPDWNEPLLRGTNYLGTAVMVRRSRLETLGGFAPTLWQTWCRYTHGLGVREVVHLPHVLLHGSVSGRKLAHPTPIRTTPQPLPKVSLVIPTRDRVELLRACMRSIDTHTSHKNFEYVIVDNGSSDKEALAYLEELKRRKDVHVVSSPGPFNFAALNNLGAFHASGGVLGLINNDIEIVDPEWMTKLASWAIEPEVGIVGCRLLFPDGTIQHGGVPIGFSRCQLEQTLQKVDEPLVAYKMRLEQDQWMTAVLGACMFMRKSVYEEVGGMDVENFPVVCNDVDLCLKTRQAGYRNVYAGSVACVHHESKSRGGEDTPEKAAAALRASAILSLRWGVGYGDPSYNPNLELWVTRFGIGRRPRAPKPWLR